MAEETNVELEQFRRQWQEEVIARSKGARPKPRHVNSTTVEQATRPPISKQGIRDIEPEEEEIHEDRGEGAYHDLTKNDETRRLGEDGIENRSCTSPAKEPQSALEHFERAVEREDQGNLGDSLTHYRKAYRLDAKVDQTYKNKHFPPSSFLSKPTNPNPSNAAATVPNPAHHSLHGPPASNVSELIQSFASLSIPGAPPPTEHSPAPPCPISTLPSEVLIEILLRTAIADVAAYARLAQVCKRLAYLTLTEDRIWKRVCSGPEFGFAAMHYSYACSIEGTPFPAPEEDEYEDATALASLSSLTLQPSSSSPTTSPALPRSISLPLTPTHPSYIHMFHHRPRLRFAGIYISTVNYVRPGASSPTQISWNTPVHIVTYYRYLRFFRDGTCISLLTTAEPVDVVPTLARENLAAGGGLPGLGSGVMREARRGRWRLSGPEATPLPSMPAPAAYPSAAKTVSPPMDAEAEPEGALSIETQGPDAKYTYHMHLALRSTSQKRGAARNTKLVWRAFWSYNRITDDWAEFGLRNDRAFWWSRVRSWGVA